MNNAELVTNIFLFAAAVLALLAAGLLLSAWLMLQRARAFLRQVARSPLSAPPEVKRDSNGAPLCQRK